MTPVIGDAEKGYRHHVREAKVNGLAVMHSHNGGDQLVDVWQGLKVFNVSWDATERLYVVAFRPGNWKDILRLSIGSQLH